MSSFLLTISRAIFFRLLAHAPEELQREAKENARGAIPALCFTEDDIRKKFAQEELWDELSDDEQREAIRQLMDAGEYEHAATVADEAITEAVARYLHEAMLEKEPPFQNGLRPSGGKEKLNAGCASCDLSEMTRRIIDSLQATALRRAGGVYFVPKGKRDELARLREMVAGLPHLEDQPFVCAFGVPDLHEAKAQMTQALHAGMLDCIFRAMVNAESGPSAGFSVHDDRNLQPTGARQRPPRWAVMRCPLLMAI